VTEWHNADELARVILDCGGKRSATPLFRRFESGVALRLPPQSKNRSLAVSDEDPARLGAVAGPAQCVSAYTAILRVSFCPSSGLMPFPSLQVLLALKAQQRPSSHITATRLPW